MATRFKLTADETDPAVLPAVRGTYSHTEATVDRRQLKTADTSTLALNTYSPDGADHLVAGDSLNVQFTSEPMAAGNVFTSGDTLKMAVQCQETNGANNLFVQIAVFVVSSDGGTLRATLRSEVLDNTEMPTAVTNRFVSTTLSAGYTTVANDRLVVELSYSGTPTGAGGVQGHNGSFRFGGSGASGDLPEDDASTSTTHNPWIEFVTTISFGAVDNRAEVSWAAVEVPTPDNRAEVSWTELEVPTPNNRSEVSWVELEVPTPDNRSEVSWAVLEVPDLVVDNRSEVSWAAIEVPDISNRSEISWAELEVPTPDNRVEISWTELEVPIPDNRSEVSFAELEVPSPDNRAEVSWAAFEVPDVGGGEIITMLVQWMRHRKDRIT